MIRARSRLDLLSGIPLSGLFTVLCEVSLWTACAGFSLLGFCSLVWVTQAVFVLSEPRSLLNQHLITAQHLGYKKKRNY